MNSRKTIFGVTAGILALGLAAGTGAASAQTTKHGFGAALKGTVQNLTGTSFGVKSSTGTVTNVTYTPSTHVVKIVTGTTADLTPNAHIRVQLKPGTTTVTSIVVEAARKAPTTGATTGAPKTHPVRTHPKSGTWGGTSTTPKGHPTGAAHAFAGGAVVSLSGSTLKLSGRGGTSVSYTLASNVTIKKVEAGTTQDLANNETVQVFATSAGAAREITILS